MTQVTAQNHRDGSESITVTWTQDSDNRQHSATGVRPSGTMVLAEKKPNGDPPSLTLWGNDESE
jgi:hypothetical protein